MDLPISAVHLSNEATIIYFIFLFCCSFVWAAVGRRFCPSARDGLSRAKEIVEVWQDSVFLAYAKEKLVLYRADFPKRKKNQLAPALKAKHESLAAQYNPKGYFPWVVVFGEDKVVKGTFVYTKDPVAHYIEQIKSF